MKNLHQNYPTVFKQNKYLKWYENLVNSNIITSDYYENHHVIPKSIIKNDFTVKLTARQHYIAHLLLIKCIQDVYKKKMLYALTAMKIKTIKHIKFNSRLFEKYKKEANISRSMNLTGIIRSEETRAKIKEKRKFQITTEETRMKMSLQRKGKKRLPESVEKTRQAHIGMKRSEETKQKMKDRKALLKPIECPHCHKFINSGNYHRWHGDNCKFNDAA